MQDDGFIVVKLGGRSFESPESRARHAARVAQLAQDGAHIVIVHGGGAQITQALAEAGLETRAVNGLRVTDAKAMAIVERVLTTLGKDLAHTLTRAGAPAVSLTGRDAGLLKGDVKDAQLGRVGTLREVDEHLLQLLAYNGITPVVAPIAVDGEGALNVNADEAAAAVAVALNAKHLVLLTDVEGVKDERGQTRASLTTDQARALVADGVASGGMIPKLEGAVDALEGGVGAVHIVNGQRVEALEEWLAGKPVGTRIEGSI